MTSFVLVHGAWHGGWGWQRITDRLRARGHDAFAPTLTGLGDRAHLLHPGVNLSLHIADVLGVIRYERLDDFVLVGHSYGGCVISGVAEALPKAIRSIVFLDAFVPDNGDATIDLVQPAVQDIIQAALERGETTVPVRDAAAFRVNEKDRAWVDSLACPQPIATMTEKISLTGARERIPIVVPETGRLLEVVARVSGARRVVEVGTAIGVSTLHLARGTGAGGRIVTFEVDAARQAAAARYLERAGVRDRVELRLEDAGAGLAGLPGGFDLAFLDGRKGDYPRHLELVLERLRPGGVVAIDNVLLDGTAATGVPDAHWPAETIATMRALTRGLVERPGVTATVLPVGDGVALAVVD